MSRFSMLGGNWSVWADEQQTGLGLLNNVTGERIEIPVGVIAALLPGVVQALSQDGRETTKMFHGPLEQGTDL